MSKKHSVLLKEDKCEGCTNCVKKCPTKAIRVHQGKASIIENLCIDCAECIRTCEYHAKYTDTNHLSELSDKKYPVALVPPSFYGQFEEEIEPKDVKNALYNLGFKEVRDVALAAEAISQKTMEYLKNNRGFYISSSCPVIVRFIKLLYPELIEYLIPFKSPVELMAERVKRELDKQGVSVYFITPCPAKLTAVHNPPGEEKSYLDGAIAVDEVYQELLDNIKDSDSQKPKKDIASPYLGFGWGQSGGEAGILEEFDYRDVLSVSGISNVKEVLEEISRDNIKGIKYFELVACPGGCVGGVLNVKNPFQAKYNLRKLKEQETELVTQDYSVYNYNISSSFTPEDVAKLADDFEQAMEKLDRLEKEKEILPGLDCAACGAPDCETLAEDIVNGLAERTDCIFMLRKEVGELADRLSNLSHVLPPVMREEGDDNDEG